MDAEAPSDAGQPDQRILTTLGLIGFIGVLDTAFMIGIIAPYAQSLGAGEAEAGLIAGLYSIVALVASVFAGLVVEAVGRRKSLLAGLLSDAALVGGYSLARTPLHLAVVRALHALGGSLVYPSSFAMVRDVSKRRLGRGVGFYLTLIGSGIAVGALTSSAIVSTLGFEWVFRTLSAVILAGFVASYLFLPETAGGSPVRESLRGLRSSLRTVARGYVLVFGLYMIFGLIVGGMGPALMRLGTVPSEEAAAAYTGMYVGISTLVSLLAISSSGILLDRGMGDAVVAAGVLTASASQLTLSLSNARGALLLSSVLLGLGLGALMTASAYFALKAPDRGAGVSAGLHQTFNILGVAVGAPMAGVILSTASAESLFLVGAVIPVATLVAYLALARR